MNTPLNLLGGLTAADFLRQYWQKRPLLVRNALPDFHTPIEPDELAGLACEEEVESRLVLERGGATPWALEHGPFDEARFSTLPETHWTLLVQECNKYLPELASLLDQFNFIPNWRIDDVMVSFAPLHGSVGPHLDQYDVFLVQGLGTRRWQISSEPVAADNVIPGLDLRIMREFTASEEWVLAPGDMLYLPPGMAHYGVALEDCMTFSVGFRAPSHAELVGGFFDAVIAGMDTEQRYSDPDLTLQTHPGEIAAGARERVRAIIRAAVSDDAAIDDWFGRYITEAKAGAAVPLDEPLAPAEFQRQFAECDRLLRSEYARFAFSQGPGGTTLYVDGRAFPLDPANTLLAPLLCDRREYAYQDLAQALESESALKLITEMYNCSYVEFPYET